MSSGTNPDKGNGNGGGNGSGAAARPASKIPDSKPAGAKLPAGYPGADTIVMTDRDRAIASGKITPATGIAPPQTAGPQSKTPASPTDTAVLAAPNLGKATSVNPMAILERLSILLQLQRRGRTASSDELPFIMVNESRQLLPYRQAVYFSIRNGKPTLKSLSGLAVPDSSAPYAQWMRKFVRWRCQCPEPGKQQRLDLAQLPDQAPKPPRWYRDWKDWLPPHALWSPLLDNRRTLIGVVIFFRETAFTDAQNMQAAHLTESYAQDLALSLSRPAGAKRSWSPLLLLLLAGAAVAAFLPVHQSVLAPSEITARRPALVRSGLDGVVDRFLVEPNQRVEAGQELVRLEDAQLRTRLTVAKKAEDMAQAEYKQLLQAALSDPKSKQRIPLVQGHIEQLAAETEYIESLMQRIVITSPMAGVVLCDMPDEWLGRPVSLGQRIMLVADPDNLELEIHLPATENMRVQVGDSVVFYPNVAPIRPMRATVAHVGFRAGEVPGVGMAYVLRADVDAEGRPLLGLRGMAKLYGPEQPLWRIVFQKPLMAARQWLGW